MNTTVSNLNRCVHCGLCLQSCPTYIATGDEADSPRGRIVLMQSMLAGQTPTTDPVAIRHLDRCLGCRGCESSCPSGVAYGEALESIKTVVTDVRGTPAIVRLVLQVMADPMIRRPLLALSRLARPIASFLGRHLGIAPRMLAATRMKIPRPNIGPTASPPNPAGRKLSVRAEATVFAGCIMEGLFSHVNDATTRTLSVNGYRIVPARGQGCCGALHLHSGLEREAKKLARANIEAFNDTAPDALIVVNSAGCGAILKEYAKLFKGDPFAEQAEVFSSRVLDVSEALAKVGPLKGAPLPLTVAADPPCHLLHAQHVTQAPNAVLSAIPDLTTVSPPHGSECCGSAGIYSLVEPELSQLVLQRKLEAIESMSPSPDVVATGNPGCIMHIGAGMQTRKVSRPVVHPVELLDLSYELAGYYADQGEVD